MASADLPLWRTCDVMEEREARGAALRQQQGEDECLSADSASIFGLVSSNKVAPHLVAPYMLHIPPGKEGLSVAGKLYTFPLSASVEASCRAQH